MDWEKQIVLRVNRLIRVRNVSGFRAIFCALRLPLLVRIRLDMTRGRAPRVRTIACDAKRLQQGFALQKYLVLAPPKHVGQPLPTAVIHRMPQPPWLFCALHKGAHFVGCGFGGTTPDHFDIARRHKVSQGLIDREQC